MADIFFSYKREDRPRVERLVRALEDRGYSLWWDADIQLGQTWNKRIKTELDTAKCVFVAWSAKSVADDGTYLSSNVENEASEGAKRKVLMPVLLDEGRVAWSHQHIQHVSLVNWKGEIDHSGLEFILQGLRKHVGIVAPPPLDELAAWHRADSANTEEEFDQFLGLFPQSKFAATAFFRGKLIQGERLRQQIQSLVQDPNVYDHMWLEHALPILSAIRTALCERLDDIQSELETQELEPKEDRDDDELASVGDELLSFSEIAEASEKLRDEQARIDEFLGQAESLRED